METAEVVYKDSKGKEIHAGDTVLIPFRVAKLGGGQAQLLHLESVEAYGHANPAAQDKLHGRTRTGIWVEPSQIELAPQS